MKHDLKTKNFERKAKRVYTVLACTAMVMMVTAVPALAADDPLTVVNNLSEFIFSYKVFPDLLFRICAA